MESGICGAPEDEEGKKEKRAEDVQITVHVEEAEDVQEIESDEDASTVELQ